MGPTVCHLPEAVGTQLRGRPQPGSQAVSWVMVHREDGASEGGADAQTTAAA